MEFDKKGKNHGKIMEFQNIYRKFSIKGAGRGGKALRGALIRERAFPPSSGFLQNGNRTVFG